MITMSFSGRIARLNKKFGDFILDVEPFEGIGEIFHPYEGTYRIFCTLANRKHMDLLLGLHEGDRVSVTCKIYKIGSVRIDAITRA